MKIGIVGLPRSGKSTLFDLLTGGRVPAGSGREARLGTAAIQDDRLDRLNQALKPLKKVPVALELVDLPGRSLADARQPDLAKDMLQPIRSADALLLVLRAFPDPYEPEKGVSPLTDGQELLQEMLLLDQMVIEKRLERLIKDLGRMKSDELNQEQALLELCQKTLEAERPIAELELTPWQETRIRGFQLFTRKPMVAALSGGDEPPEPIQLPWGIGSVGIQARLEQELAELDPEDRAEMAAEMGLEGSRSQKVLWACLQMTGRIVFFTIGDDEVRAWWMPEGGSAPDAAGRIHTDMARGFIRAEVISYDELAELEFSETRAKEIGRMRVEGKTYRVQDGDVINIRFNL